MKKFEAVDALVLAKRWMQEPVWDIVASPRGVRAVVGTFPEHPYFDDQEPENFEVPWEHAFGLGPEWNFAGDDDVEDSAHYLKLAEAMEALAVKLRQRAAG